MSGITCIHCDVRHYLYTQWCQSLTVYTVMSGITCIHCDVRHYLYTLWCQALPVYTVVSVITCIHSNVSHYLYIQSSSSSSDRVDSRGPLRQPRVAMTTRLGPFSTNAEGCTVADLLDPWMARASWPSPPTRTKTGAGSCCCDLW